MRTIDAVKTYKELEDAREQIKRLENAGDVLCAAAAFMGWHDEIEQWNKAKGTK
jgi:cation transport regulator ChaB